MAKKRTVKHNPKRDDTDNRSFADIDPDQLDVEWMAQPGLYFDWACRLADARSDLDAAKSAFDLEKACIDQEVREDPATYGLEKVTESQVSNAVLRSARYGQAQAEVHKAHHAVNILQAGVAALDHRKKALESMVSLHGMNYYSEPKARGEAAADEVGDMKKRRIRKRRS